MHHQSLLHKLLLHAAVVVLGIVFLLPLFWILQTSLKPDSAIAVNPPKLVPVMTEAAYAEAAADGSLTAFEQKWGYGWTLNNYRRVFAELPFLRYFFNTVLIVVFSVIGTVLSCLLVGYAFACLRWPDRDWIFVVVIATMLLPYQVTLIPVFLLFRQLGWIDTLLPLVVPQFLAPAFFVFLVRQFLLSIPRELLEAARSDGASEWRILFQIVAPMAKPALLTVVIFSTMFAWNDFLGPLIYLSSESSKTLAIGLQSMVSEFGAEWGMLMAAGVVTIIPVLILFFIAQKYFIEGLMYSGTKG